MSYRSPEPPRARSSRLPPSAPNQGRLTPADIEAAFGLNSPTYAETSNRLTDIYTQSRHVPQVAARFREWQQFRTGISPELDIDESSFINQTYLALLSHLVARRFLAPRQPIRNAEELLEVINVDYFSRRGISNFGEGDVFSWLLVEPRWELNLGSLVLETVQGLADAAELHEFSQATPGILDTLSWQMAPSSTSVPRWLAEYVVEDEMGLADDSGLSLVDPTCGTGTFLCAAIGAMSRAIENSGGDPIDILFDAPDRIRGMDADPLSVTLARLNYLLAFGKLVQEEHPPFLVPVYLADASGAGSLEGSDITLSTTAGEFPLPDPLVENPLMLDWLLGRLTNYMDGAQLRLHVQEESVATQEVLNAYYNYLTSAKPRTPIPEALTPEQADNLLSTARRLIELHIQGEGTLWLHLVQNMAAPTIFSRRGFDRLVGVQPIHGTNVDSAHYLRSDGKSGIVTTIAEAEKNSAGNRLVSLEAALPGRALLVSGSEGRARLELTGGEIPADSSWESAKADVRFVE